MLCLKSKPIYYKAEESGLKPNTVRFTDDWDENDWKEYDNAEEVQISNTYGLSFFIRKIKHKCRYKNIVIISWEHDV